MNEYSHLLYKRGFLFTDLSNPSFSDFESQEVFKKWKSIHIGKYKLYYDPCLTLGSATNHLNKIVILGMVLNPFDSEIDPNKIANTLLDYKNISDKKFLEYFNQLSGRFVLISLQNRQVEILNDACGTRTVFYDRYHNNTVVSSHSSLIAHLLGYEFSLEALYFYHHKKYRDAAMKKLPGLLSPFEGIYILTPNTRYLIPSRKIERFFPFKDNENKSSYEELEQEIAKLMVSQLRLVNSKSKIAMSLTAGVDSRLSLAASKNIKEEILFFTYLTKNNIHMEDSKTASDICNEFHLNHQIFKWGEGHLEGQHEFDMIWEKNLGMRRGIMWLNKLYVDSYPKDRIHIRSNIAEVVKADSDLYEDNGLSAQQLAYLYTTTEMNKDVKVINKFSEFMEVTSFKEQNMFNYDYRDLFEWEYKMCQWHSYLLLENDMSFDTFIIYNNRDILAKMLSLPYEDRVHKRLFYGLIKRMWPELLKFPINGKYIK